MIQSVGVVFVLTTTTTPNDKLHLRFLQHRPSGKMPQHRVGYGSNNLQLSTVRRYHHICLWPRCRTDTNVDCLEGDRAGKGKEAKESQFRLNRRPRQCSSCGRGTFMILPCRLPPWMTDRRTDRRESLFFCFAVRAQEYTRTASKIRLGRVGE